MDKFFQVFPSCSFVRSSQIFPSPNMGKYCHSLLVLKLQQVRPFCRSPAGVDPVEDGWIDYLLFKSIATHQQDQFFKHTTNWNDVESDSAPIIMACKTKT